MADSDTIDAAVRCFARGFDVARGAVSDKPGGSPRCLRRRGFTTLWAIPEVQGQQYDPQHPGRFGDHAVVRLRRGVERC